MEEEESSRTQVLPMNCSIRTCGTQGFLKRAFSSSTTSTIIRQRFRHVLPLHRLGHECSSYEEFCHLLAQRQQCRHEEGNQHKKMTTRKTTNHDHVREKRQQQQQPSFQPLQSQEQEQPAQQDNLAKNNKKKHYSLVVVKETARRRILLGRKHRGFGAGMYNSFGGKLEEAKNELCYPVWGAQRELHEETGIWAPLTAIQSIGTLQFTFDPEDDDEEEDEQRSYSSSSTSSKVGSEIPNMMVVHLFQVHVASTEHKNDDDNGTNKLGNDCAPSQHHEQQQQQLLREDGVAVVPLGGPDGNAVNLQGCTDEITPIWFDDWHDLPLHQMFADDSVWLTQLLYLSLVSDKGNEDDDDVDHFTKQQQLESEPLLRQEGKRQLRIDGWFHFLAGGVQVNTLSHYYVNCRFE